MEYLTKDTYGICDKIDALQEALGYMLLDENELPDNLASEMKYVLESLNEFKKLYKTVSSV